MRPIYWSAFVATATFLLSSLTVAASDNRVMFILDGSNSMWGQIDGTAKISGVKDISEVFGSYASASAHAGVGPSAEATAMTKGKVSLALAGTGRGVDLGIAFSKFKIVRAD